MKTFIFKIEFAFILYLLIENSDQLPIGYTACSHIPYDFYRLPNSPDYFFLRYEYLNFFDARDFCTNIGMDLPTITSQEQNALVASFVQYSRYNMYYTNGFTIGNGTNVWLNGDPFIYSNFIQNGFAPTDQHIVIYKNGSWNKVSSNTLAGVICRARCY